MELYQAAPTTYKGPLLKHDFCLPQNNCKKMYRNLALIYFFMCLNLLNTNLLEEGSQIFTINLRFQSSNSGGRLV
jgi:hypothetical protein